MSIAVLYGDLLATDTLVVVGDAEYEEKVQAVIPPSLRYQRKMLEEGGKVIAPTGSDWVFAFACDAPGAWEGIREALDRSEALRDGDLERLRDPSWSLPEDTVLMAVHRQSREVRFFKKRFSKGKDASVVKFGLDPERPMAIGSGSWFAMTALREKRCDAPKAAQEVCKLDAASGGRVYWLDLRSGEEGYVACPRQPDPERDEMPTMPGC
ncbi:MAG: hypothetical protein HQL53_01790 [Magnetococcales bacterium]|nr:hypothetical protein [Magnetococcales bacterium]